MGGRPTAPDAFDRPATAARVWSRPVGGYALDAVDAPGCEPGEGAIRRFLETAADGHATSHQGVGLGTPHIS